MPFDFINVEKEYEKDENIKREDVKILSEWMGNQPHLPKITDFQIVQFLHSCYYAVEPAKRAIDNYFTVRTQAPELFASPLDWEEFRKEMDIMCLAILPGLTAEGYAVNFSKLLNSDPENYNFNNQVKFGDLAFTLTLHQRGFRNGIVAVVDMKGLSMKHMTKMNFAGMKKHSFYMQKAVPVRIKAIHYINVVPFIDKVMTLIKPLLKKELLELITFHTHPNDSLYKHVPKKMLPKDYGGDAPALSELHEQMKKNVLGNKEFFKWMDSLKVEENKRPPKSKNSGGFLGLKKLEID